MYKIEYQLKSRGVLVSRHRSLKAAEKALNKFGNHGVLYEINDGKIVEQGISHGNGNVEWTEVD